MTSRCCDLSEYSRTTDVTFFAPLMRKEIILKAMQFEVSSSFSLLVNCYQKTKNYQNLIEQPKSKRKYVYD